MFPGVSPYMHCVFVDLVVVFTPVPSSIGANHVSTSVFNLTSTIRCHPEISFFESLVAIIRQFCSSGPALEIKTSPDLH
jgi:hypothetical protein